MSLTGMVLPFVWATSTPAMALREPIETSQRELYPEMRFYRRYTEGLLKRYVRMSMEAGKVPSLLGQEMFRGHVTSYRVDSFEDVVIFLHDVEACLAKLNPEQQGLVSRIALQEFTVEETASRLGIRPKTVVRRYRQSIDRLTRVFLQVKMIEPQPCCQVEGLVH